MDDRHDDLREFDMLMRIIRNQVLKGLATTGARSGLHLVCFGGNHKLLAMSLAAFARTFFAFSGFIFFIGESDDR